MMLNRHHHHHQRYDGGMKEGCEEKGRVRADGKGRGSSPSPSPYSLSCGASRGNFRGGTFLCVIGSLNTLCHKKLVPFFLQWVSVKEKLPFSCICTNLLVL